MKSVGLNENQASRRILKLLGSEQQRIAIARSLSYNHLIIIADEPTANFDKATEKEILDILSVLRMKKINVLLSLRILLMYVMNLMLFLN